MNLISTLKNIVPATVKTNLRSLMYSKELGLLAVYLKTRKNYSKKVRLGSDYGGWVIPDNFLKPGNVCYCVGCGEDITFDLALIEQYNCDVVGVDPTPRSIAYVEKTTANNSKYLLEKLALWENNGTQRFYAPNNAEFVSHSLTNKRDEGEYIEVNTIRLSDLLQKNKHQKAHLIKLDIEGAESIVINTILEDNIDVDILCIEFDELVQDKQQGSLNVRKAVKRLQEYGFNIFWIEALNITFVKN